MPAGKNSNIMFKSNIPITCYLCTTINTVAIINNIINLYLPHFFIFSSQTSTAPSVFRMTTNTILNFIRCITRCQGSPSLLQSCQLLGFSHPVHHHLPHPHYHLCLSSHCCLSGVKNLSLY